MDRSGQDGTPRDRPRPRKRLAEWCSRWGVDALLTAGAALISAGAAMICIPAGLIVGGALLVAGGILLARGDDER